MNRLRDTSMDPFRSKAFWRNRRGNFAIMTAIMAVPIVLVIAAAVDMTRLLGVKEAIRSAADAAALAAASSSLDTAAERSDLADRVFAANLDLAKVGSLIKSNALQETGGGATPRQYTYNVDVTLDDGATLMPIADFWNANVGSVVQAADQKLDIALVLDNSGSMHETDGGTTTRMQELIDAAQAFIDVFPADGMTQIALVPFDSQVKVDLAAINAVSGQQANPYAEIDCTTVAAEDLDLCIANQTTTTESNEIVTGNEFSMNCNLLSGATDQERLWCAAGRTGFDLPSLGTGAYVTSVKRGRWCYFFCLTGYGITASQYVATLQDGNYRITRHTGECASFSSYSVGDPSPCDTHDGSWLTIFDQPASSSTTETVTTTTTAYSTGPATSKTEDAIAANANLLWLGTEPYQGCVIDRLPDADITGFAAPVIGTISEYPKANCATTTLATVSGLTTGFASLKSMIAAMQPSHNTNITIGVAWGMEALSASAPLTGVRSDARKIMVIMTDGENTQNRWVDARHLSGGTTLVNQTKSTLIDAKTLAACQTARDNDIEIFTLNLIDADSGLLQSCASGDDYVYSAGHDDLVATFEAIARKIRRIRLVS